MDLLTDQWVRTEELLLEELRRNGMLPELLINLVLDEDEDWITKTKPLPGFDLLYPHQLEAIEKLAPGKILVGGVGVGKTMTALGYYAKYESPKTLLVITTAKKRDSLDWEEEAHRFMIGTRDDDFQIHGTIIVDSWQNINKYEDVTDVFLIADEQRLVGSGAWTKSFLKIARRNRWILLSATPGDTWLDYIPVFIANGFYKNRTWFKREHVVYNTYSRFPKVERYTGVNKLLKLRHSIQVEMPYVKHTTRHTHYIEVEHDKELLHQAMVDRWHVYEERPIRDVAELFSVMRKIVNSDPSRIEAVRCLMQKHPKLIIFYNFNYELEMLRGLGEIATSLTVPRPMPENSSELLRMSSKPSDSKDQISAELSSLKCDTLRNTSMPEMSFAVAEWNGHKHEPIPETDSWVYLVQYVAGSEGWNCTETDATVMYSLTYSFKNWHQAYGRIDRINTPYTNLNYYVLRSKSAIDSGILRSLKEKRNFNEKSLNIVF